MLLINHLQNLLRHKLKKILTKHDSKIQVPWRPLNIYHYIQWNNNKPDFVVDISNFIKNKLDAVMCYKSQFYDPNDNSEDTPISTKNFLDCGIANVNIGTSGAEIGGAFGGEKDR